MSVPEGYKSLGKIGISYKGDYNSNTVYERLDAVYHNGSTYLAIKDAPDGAPRDDKTNWIYLAKGYDGETVDVAESEIAFTDSETRENIVSGEKVSTVFGKIKKFFTDLTAPAFAQMITTKEDLLATKVTGYVPDAKAVADVAAELNRNLNIRYNEDTDKVQLLFNGIWTDWKNGNMLKKYLYVSGNECGDLTGGYAVGYYSNHCTGAKVTNDNYLQINISGDKQYNTYAWVTTKKLINTTGYTKLKAKFYTSKATLKAALSLSQQYVAGAQSNVTNIAYPAVVVKTDSLASTSPIEVEIDISAYQGNYYVVFGARDCVETGSIYCSEIYLI